MPNCRLAVCSYLCQQEKSCFISCTSKVVLSSGKYSTTLFSALALIRWRRFSIMERSFLLGKGEGKSYLLSHGYNQVASNTNKKNKISTTMI